MSPHMIGVLVLGGGCVAVVVWVLHKIGKMLVAVAEAVATVAVVFVALWWLVKAGAWAVRQIVRHWRTTVGLVAVLGWWHWLGWLSPVLAVGGVMAVLLVWRLVDVMSFDRWAWRWLRAWWLRWTVYGPK